MGNLLPLLAVETVPDLADTTELIEANGIETVLSALVVIAIVVAIGLFSWWARRRISDSFIHKDDVIDYMKQKHPKLIKQGVQELSDLREHDAFDMWNRELRYCDTLQIKDKDGNIDHVQTAIAKDIIQWNIRGYRNVFKKMLDESYNLVDKDPDTFEEYFGDSKGFGHMVNNAFTQVKAAVAYKLKDEQKMPVDIYDSFDQYRSEVNETVRDMLQIAVANHTMNYWRMHEVLNSQYAFTRTLRLSTLNFFKCSGIDFTDVEYDGSSDNTLINFSPEVGMTGRMRPAVGAIFDYK